MNELFIIVNNRKMVKKMSEPVSIGRVGSANSMDGIAETTLEADVVVEAILLEFNVDVLESNDEALSGRGGSVGRFDVQPEVQVVRVRRRIVGRFHAAFPRHDRRIRRQRPHTIYHNHIKFHHIKYCKFQTLILL